MTSSDDLVALCSTELADRISKTNYNDENAVYLELRNLTQQRNEESTQCLIAANHYIAERLAPTVSSRVLSTHLSVFFEHLKALTPVDKARIADRVPEYMALSGERAAWVIGALTGLRIDMRDYFGPRIDITLEWGNIRHENNPSFQMMLHNAVFGEFDYDGFRRGLDSVTDMNVFVAYLYAFDFERPTGYKDLLRAYQTDSRMNAPGFVNPQSIGEIVEDLLRAGD
ncbi:hypothetical protein [Pseudaestuariivita rosea]|uniref:hypothetical protein n=1 Tax=Pseudaestuariivita rosea TaxID=2763263 RepID=UPI001ABA1DE8|nr:hypothetical protein [Pseudaestuariivita rosea]